MTARAVVEAALARIASQSAPQRLHRRHRRAGAAQGRRGRRGDRRGRRSGAARRRALRGQEPVRRRGLPTLAGSKINRDHAAGRARRDAGHARWRRPARSSIGALNMGEYAYDFTGENAHDGASRNPHDPGHMSGGSSGGSGTAAAAGMVPLTLGSDTNGSIRVPSSLCGLFGLKPTYGRLSRGGTFPFVASLDHLGPLGALGRRPRAGLRRDAGRRPARSRLHASGRRSRRRANWPRASTACASRRAGGYFAGGAMPEAFEAVDARRQRARRDADASTIADAQAARGAAFSSPWPRARRCISTGCAPATAISIPTCATG